MGAKTKESYGRTLKAKKIMEDLAGTEKEIYLRGVSAMRPFFMSGPRWCSVTSLLYDELISARELKRKCLHPVGAVVFVRVGASVGYNRCDACGSTVEVASYKTARNDL